MTNTAHNTFSSKQLIIRTKEVDYGERKCKMQDPLCKAITSVGM